MKRLPILIAAVTLLALCSCLSDDEKLWNDYKEWRSENDAWLETQLAEHHYTKVTPKWNEELNVYMRWLNDRSKTEGNLTPLYTSTVKVKYIGWLYDGTPFDSSYLQVDSLAELQLSGLISGWNIAMEQMRVGDHVELIVPYTAAYGSSSLGTVKPYSTLRFDVELRDISAYEIH